MRAVIYTRTSTKQQRTDMQLDALHELVKNSKYELVDVIEDVGVSGGKKGRTRAGMSQLMDMVNRREVDVVCVYSEDRIGKTLVGFFAVVAQMEKDLNNSRVRDGVAAAKAKGKQIGRKPLSASKLNQIREMRRQGKGMNFIAKHLSVGNSQVLRVCREMAEAA